MTLFSVDKRIWAGYGYDADSVNIKPDVESDFLREFNRVSIYLS